VEIVIVPTAVDGGRLVADVVARALGAAPRVHLGLATGSSPLAAYAELIRRHREEGLSFAGATAWLLDEYVGMGPDDPRSYRHTIRTELTDHVGLDPARVHGPDGAHPDPLAAAAAYEEALRAAGPIAVQVLGIGVNGHVGFNEPSSSLSSPTRIKTLTDRTRADNARFFGGDLAAVPRHVLTQGLGTIARARHLVLTASGEHKAAAVAAAVEGPLSAACPASVLQLHPHATVVVDEAAAARLREHAFYREVYAHKPENQLL
jgi:glucosamine-6-phosphate deaminase